MVKQRETQPFPIVEAFGYDVRASTPEARGARAREWCPFTKTECEKLKQYGAAYCSVTYAAAGDSRQRRTYAVCDHRLDGTPVMVAIRDHFPKGVVPTIVSEVTMPSPKTSFDYVAFTRTDGVISDIIAIETQAIDLRGGSVMHAWEAWQKGDLENWRVGYEDAPKYGVNMANIYKRLGLQVATKGSYLKSIGVPLYVVMQDPPFEYLRDRVRFVPTARGAWDITFMTFDYSGNVLADGMHELTHRQCVRTTLAQYIEALARGGEVEREDFLRRVERKASSPSRGATADSALDDEETDF